MLRAKLARYLGGPIYFWSMSETFAVCVMPPPVPVTVML